MKNATIYAKNIKKLLTPLPKTKPATPEDLVLVLVESVLAPDAPRKDVHRASVALTSEFVDLNELRVSPAKEIVDAIGRDFPNARDKAETLVRVLNSVFDRSGKMCLEYMREMPRKDLRRHLAEIGLSPFSAAYVMLIGFDIPTLPVDVSLVDALKMNDDIGPCDIEEAQAFIERAFPAKQILAIHEFFRAYIEKNAKAIAKWAKANPEDATKAAAILPPPKVRMLVKHQPLPGQKDDMDDDVVLDPTVIEEEPDLDAPADDDVDLELPPVEVGEDLEEEGGPAKPKKNDVKPFKELGKKHAKPGKASKKK